LRSPRTDVGDGSVNTSTTPKDFLPVPAFDHACVSDAMRAGVITCAPDTPLKAVARMMATFHIHCIVVKASEIEGRSDERRWGILSDLDLVEALSAGGAERTAAATAVTEVVTVRPEESLERAAQLMAEHATAHLVVVDLDSDEPVGILSTLDVAGLAAWGRT
jgi:CBS domain-containing protein